MTTPHSFLLCLILLSGFSAKFSKGQTPTLVRDMHPGTIGASSSPGGFRRLGKLGLFVAFSSNTGSELWRSDGTSSGTFPLELVPGPTGSNPQDLVVAGNHIFFEATTPSQGNELFVSDGTRAGTKIAKDLLPGSSSGGPRFLVPSGNKVFFYARDTTGFGIFVSDGTPAGTKKILAGGFYDQGVGLGGKFFFSFSTRFQGRELWVSDGTPQGTKMVKDIIPGIGSGLPSRTLFSQNMVTAGNYVYFMAQDLLHGTELWRSDGTAAGTTLVKDLAPGRTSGIGAPYLTALGNKVVFSGNSGSGTKLYITDGTSQGTVPLGAFSFFHPENLLGKIYFWNGNSIAVTDGTKAGTKNIATLPPSTRPLGFFKESAFPLRQPLFQTDGTNIYFQAVYSPSQFVVENRLFKVNPSPSLPTLLLRGLKPSGPRSLVRAFLGLPGFILASADGGLRSNKVGSKGIELWKTTGTPKTTTLLKNIQPDKGLGSLIQELSDQHQGILFRGSAPDPKNPNLFFGRELYHSDGTFNGTGLLQDIATGPLSSSVPGNFAWIEGKTFFAAQRLHGRELFITDGTSKGTFELKDLTNGPGGSNPGKAVDFQGLAVFASGTVFTPSGRELWKSNGTSSGTVLIKDLRPGRGSSNPQFLTVFGKKLFFAADDGVHGVELFVSDGTTSGTMLFKDIESGSRSSFPRNLVVVGKTLYFSARTSTGGRELWKSDGTPAGTKMVVDLAPGASSGVSDSTFDPIVSANGLVFFVGRGQIYQSNGTAQGTKLLNGRLSRFSLRPGSSNLTSTPKGIFFTVNDGIHGSEPWFSNGTPSGTILLKDIYPGTMSSMNSFEPILSVGSSGRKIWFRANDPLHGSELWETDGTPTGTKMVADINPGGSSSFPSDFTLSNGKVYMVADNGPSGRELFVSFPGATAKPFGHPCATENFGPSFHSQDPILGTSVRLSGGRAKGHIGVLLLGIPPIQITKLGGGCSLYLPLSRFFVAGSFGSSPNGKWNFNLPVPNQPSLVGIGLLLQGAFVNLSPIHVDFTQAFEWTLGQ